MAKGDSCYKTRTFSRLQGTVRKDAPWTRCRMLDQVHSFYLYLSSQNSCYRYMKIEKQIRNGS